MSALAQEIPAQPEPTENLPVAVRAQRALAGVTTESALTLLADKAKEIQAITNPDGYKQCHAVRMELRGTRVTIEKAGKAARDDANAFSKAVIAEEKRLVGFIEPEEIRLDGLQKKWDADRQAEKEAAAKAEAERVAKIRTEIDWIKTYPIRLQGKPSSEILEAAQNMSVSYLKREEFMEFAVEAEEAVIESTKILFRMAEAQKKAEHEAALTSCRETIRKTYLIPPGLAGKSAAQVQGLRDEMAALDLVVMDELHAETDQARAEALAYLDDIIATKTANEQAETERKQRETEDKKRREAEARERQIRDAIANTRAIPTGLISASSARLRHEAECLKTLIISPLTYAPLTDEMEAARCETVNTLTDMAHAAEQREQQEAENKARQEELDRQEREAQQKREQEERDRQAEREREEAQRREAEEAERRAKEAREQAEWEAAEAARTRLENAAPKLLSLLEEAVNIIGEYAPGFTVWLDSAEAAIAEATGA